MAKPTLALIPASQGSKVFSVLPSSGVGDFDFSRGTIATRINSQGLIENVASGQSRLEYPMIDGVVSGCPSLLLESSRTNLVTYSNDFTDASWKSGTFVGNNAISPDGTLNADKFVFIQGASYPQFYKSVSGLVVGQEYTSTIYIKKTENSSDFEMNSSGILFNPTNEWQRVVKTFTATSTTQTVLLNYVISVGVGVINEIYVAFAQLEQGSYPTSYIPTNGTAVTRAAETANGAGDASTFNDSEGVFMVEMSALDDDLTNRIISLSDGTNNNIISVQLSNAQSNDIIAYYNATGQTGRAISTTSYNIKSFNKTALVWNNSSFKFYVNGYLMGSATIEIPLVDGTLNQLKFQYGNGTLPFYGKTKQIQYFQTALTDSELEELTSWDSFGAMAIGQLYTIK